MNRPTRSGSDNSAARAFACVGFPTLLAKLYRYATGTLGLAAIDAESAGVVEATDLVNTLVERGLGGTLPWSLPDHATTEQIVAHACMKLYAMRSALRKTAAYARGDDALDERADEAPDAFARLSGERAIADVVRAFEHDAEASAHIAKMREGKTRKDIASELGCTAGRVDVVRNRIVRGMTALRESANDNGEDEPPSSGPRGSYHAQATEERRRADAEPHRGAGGAGGRR